MLPVEKLKAKYAIPQSVVVKSTGNLITGSGDQLNSDKTTTNWKRWVYYKSKKRIPDLSVNLYNNKILIEKLERAAICVLERLNYVHEEAFNDAMKEAQMQLNNPRTDSAEAIDRLGKICIDEKLYFKAVICFEISLHMRKICFKEHDNELTLSSLMLLAMAWAGDENYHRAITVLEKALKMAENLYSHHENEKDYGFHVVEVLNNLGTCWESLKEHHSALSCYGRAEKLRKKLNIPQACLRSSNKGK